MAVKKGGLKQNLVWVVIIGVLGFLAFSTLSNGNSGSKSTTKTETNGSVAAGEDSALTRTPTSKIGAGGQNLGAGFNLSPKNGGTLGGSYLLKNLSITKGSGFESANIFLKSVSGGGSFAKYGASISGSTIIVTLTDTKNFDLDVGSPSYSGANPLIVNGSVIKNIEWVQDGENSLRININLKKQAAFDDVVLNNPPTLEIRVAI